MALRVPPSPAAQYEQFFGDLVRVIGEHEARIAQMAASVSARATAADLGAIETGLASELTAVRDRLIAVEQEQVFDLDGADVPVADAVRDLHQCVRGPGSHAEPAHSPSAQARGHAGP